MLHKLFSSFAGRPKPFSKLLFLVCIFALSSFSADAQKNISDTFRVEGVCVSCKNRIEKAMKMKGIKTAVWEVSTKMLAVNFNPDIIKPNEIYAKLAEVGHDNAFAKATDAAYEALPECCLYKDPANEGHFLKEGIPETTSDMVSGVVMSEDNKGNFTPLAGATILWAGQSKGSFADAHGVFSIPRVKTGSRLIISFSGYQSDSLEVKEPGQLQVILAANGQLKDIKITAKSRTTYINTMGAFRSVMINSKDLLKAACCNLSESFETNPSVDVSYADAVTGSKQIQLLGLSGNYTLLTVENLPGPRGLATSLGLNSIAGPWIESIQLSKGTGSVVNGFESIAGQINVELKKPENSEKLYVNGYINQEGKTDVNVNIAQPIGKRWSTGLLIHDDFLTNKIDQNKDGFRDLPTGNLFSAINRWHYNDDKGLMIQFGAKALIDNKVGGEINFDKRDKSAPVYGLGIDISRYEGFAKIGYVFPGKKYKSIGLQLSAFNHNQNSFFGLKKYDAVQSNIYSNLIYQSIIGNSNHKFRTGISFVADKYNETFEIKNYKRYEIVPGAFFEYTYDVSDQLSIVAGIREDHNSLYGWFTTPRLNARYEPIKGTVVRVSAGRGQRTANIFAENMGVLVSAREVNLLSTQKGKAYGLNPEVSWNKGISVDQKMKLFTRDAMLSLDYYRNDFQNQIVVDLENPREINFYNLAGKSYSNSFQAEFNFIPVRKLDVRVAYRLFDVKSTYGNELLSKPFTARNRAFANFGYELQGWKFDYTVNYVGEKRIPSTSANPVKYQIPGTSPSYMTMNAQVSKSLLKNKNLEVYVGGENLTNYFQKDVIIAADAPFGNFFDASMIWGPITGRMIYAGFRFKIR
ncbi:MAG: TonB-dependent receptor [Ginsengibacter sp.]